MRGLGILALALMLAGGTSPAFAALNFDFSFTNVTGSVSGTVTGEVFGLSDNATSAATDLVIDSYPAGLSLPAAPWDIFNDPGLVIFANSFTVTGGVIAGGFFRESDSLSGGAAGLVLNGLGIESFLQDDGFNNVLNGGGLAALNFALVPEPASMGLFLAGLFGLRWGRRRG